MNTQHIDQGTIQPVKQKEESDNPSTIANIGKKLKETRISQGLKTIELAAKLKLPEKQLLAMEGSSFYAYNLSYTKAMLRSYAKAMNLNIDSQLVMLGSIPDLALKPSEIHIKTYSKHTQFSDKATNSHERKTLWHIRKILWIVILVLTLLCAMLSAYIFSVIDYVLVWQSPEIKTSKTIRSNISTKLTSSQNKDKQDLQNILSLAENVNHKDLQATNIVTAKTLNINEKLNIQLNNDAITSGNYNNTNTKILLTLKFNGTSWYEITAKSFSTSDDPSPKNSSDISFNKQSNKIYNKILFSGIENQGVVKQFSVIPPIKLTLGNTEVVTVTFREKLIDLARTDSKVTKIVLQ